MLRRKDDFSYWGLHIPSKGYIPRFMQLKSAQNGDHFISGANLVVKKLQSHTTECTLWPTPPLEKYLAPGLKWSPKPATGNPMFLLIQRCGVLGCPVRPFNPLI